MKSNSSVCLIGVIWLCLHISAFGQKNSWDKFIQAGDDALAQNRSADSEVAYREAIKLSEKFKENDPRIAATLIKLAESLNLQGKRGEAESSAKSALIALEKTLKASKSKDPAERFYKLEISVTILDKAGDILAANQKHGEAEPLYKTVIALREGAIRPQEKPKSNEDFLTFMAYAMTHPHVKLADAYYKLANFYFNQERFAEAEPFLFKALKATETEYGANKPTSAVILSKLATRYAIQKRYDQAEPLYSRAVSIFEKFDWLDQPEVAVTYDNYSLMLRRMGRETEAATFLEKAKVVRNRVQRTTN